MLFPTESIRKARLALLDRLEAGALTQEQAFRAAMEMDPFDAVALTILGEECFGAGELAGAAEYFWRAANADACMALPWFKLSACLTGESQEFRDGLMELAATKALRDPHGIDGFDEYIKKDAESPGAEDMLTEAAAQFREGRAGEPEDVTERLRPYRSIDDLLELAPEGLDAELVDGILEEGARCGPLLVGVLRAMATGTMVGGDPSPVICSLALLGEIGDPAVLPELIECYNLEDEGIQAATHWAIKRIATRRPEESFEAIRKAAPGAGADRRCDLAMAASYVPFEAGRRDFLLSLLDGLATFEKSDRHDLFMSVALALEYTEGKRGRETAWSLLGKYAAVLPKRTRGELRDAYRIHGEMDRAAPVTSESPEAKVYDLCELGFVDDEEEDVEDEDDDLFEEEDDHVQEYEGLIPEPVHRGRTVGRNDPCWCGSGKKYKKCHLDSDAAQATKEPEEAAPLVQHSGEEAGLRTRVIDFATSTLRKRGMEESLKIFLGSEPPGGVDNDAYSREAVDWMIHDYVPERLGHTLTEEFLLRAPGGLSAEERKLVEGWTRARFSIFEVGEVRAGTGVGVRDVLVGGEFFVDDVNASRWALAGDSVLARIEELGAKYIFTAIVLSIPPTGVGRLTDWARAAQARSGLDWDAFLRRNSHRLRQGYSRMVRRMN